MICLGISIGTTRTGVCVIKDGTLRERRVHTYPHTFTDNKARIITNKYRHYIDKYRVTDIAVKIPAQAKQTKAVKLLLHRIKKLAEECGCEFDLTNMFEMKSLTDTYTSEETIRYITEKYPELKLIYDKDRERDFKHSKKIFEAVLVAYLHRERSLKRQVQ